MKNPQVLNGLVFRIRKSLSTTIIFIMFIAFSGMAQEDSENLFRNSDLEFSKAGRPTHWIIAGSVSSASGYKSGKSICLVIDKKGATYSKAVMIQSVKNLKPGNYIFTAYVKLSQKIDSLMLCRIIKQEDKSVYKFLKLAKAEQEPEKWTKVMLEFDIPEGIDSALIGFDCRNKESGTGIWIDSPCLKMKNEQ